MNRLEAIYAIADVMLDDQRLDRFIQKNGSDFILATTRFQIQPYGVVAIPYVQIPVSGAMSKDELYDEAEALLCQLEGLD